MGPGRAEPAPGVLYVVATPLGRTDDLSPRARAVLAGVDLVLAEDTRRAGLLFSRLGITARRFTSFHDHNEAARLPGVLAGLLAGRSMALVSDAGTPLLSDPGYRLVRACRQAGAPVKPVPGPSAVTAALCAAGIAPQPFTFLGFLPRKSSDIRRLFERHAAAGATLVFFERRSRLAKCLPLALSALGPRECVIAREMTKTHEEFLTGTLAAFAAAPPEILGEVTVVLGPPLPEAVTPRAEVLRLAAEESGRPREVARRLAERVAGWTAKDIYAMLVAAGKPAGPGTGAE